MAAENNSTRSLYRSSSPPSRTRHAKQGDVPSKGTVLCLTIIQLRAKQGDGSLLDNYPIIAVFFIFKKCFDFYLEIMLFTGDGSLLDTFSLRL